MIYENEIMTLLFGLGTLVFVVANIKRLRSFPHGGLFLTAFCMVLPGWMATLFDQLFWGELFNAIEHVSYAAAMTLFALWTYLVTSPREQNRS